MEIMIQFRKSTWSIGSKGWRVLKTWDWDAMKAGFERAFKIQNEADDTEHAKYAEAHSKLSNCKWTSKSNWRGDENLGVLPTNEVASGKETYKA